MGGRGRGGAGRAAGAIVPAAVRGVPHRRGPAAREVPERPGQGGGALAAARSAGRALAEEPVMAFKLVFLPPIGERTREMAAEVGRSVPEARVVVTESEAEAEREIVDAEAAWGRSRRRSCGGPSG